MAGSSREFFFFDDTTLEFMGKTSKSSKDNTDMLVEALPLHWETTPCPIPPISAIGEPHPSFALTSCKI